MKFQERETIKSTPTGSIYFFRGMMRCPECGGKMCGHTNKKPYGRYKEYRCGNRGRGCNNHSSTSEMKVEKQLLVRLAEFMEDEIARVELEETKPKPKPKRKPQANVI